MSAEVILGSRTSKQQQQKCNIKEKELQPM
jgi:hypothetical protein